MLLWHSNHGWLRRRHLEKVWRVCCLLGGIELASSKPTDQLWQQQRVRRTNKCKNTRVLVTFSLNAPRVGGLILFFLRRLWEAKGTSTLGASYFNPSFSSGICRERVIHQGQRGVQVCFQSRCVGRVSSTERGLIRDKHLINAAVIQEFSENGKHLAIVSSQRHVSVHPKRLGGLLSPLGVGQAFRCPKGLPGKWNHGLKPAVHIPVPSF